MGTLASSAALNDFSTTGRVRLADHPPEVQPMAEDQQGPAGRAIGGF